MKKTSIISIFIIIANACSPKDTQFCHYSFKIKNHTDRTLYMDLEPDTIFGDEYRDPRELTNQPFATKVSAYAGVKSEIAAINFTSSGRPRCAENLYKPNEVIYVFVFDSIDLENKKWDDVIKKYQITYRYKFTFDELKKNNFVIEYNGEHGYGSRR